MAATLRLTRRHKQIQLVLESQYRESIWCCGSGLHHPTQLNALISAMIISFAVLPKPQSPSYLHNSCSWCMMINFTRTRILGFRTNITAFPYIPRFVILPANCPIYPNLTLYLSQHLAPLPHPHLATRLKKRVERYLFSPSGPTRQGTDDQTAVPSRSWNCVV